MLNKKDTILEGDNIYFVVKYDDLDKALDLFNDDYVKTDKIIIVGGGAMSQEITKSILKSVPNISIKIVEDDIKKAEKLSEECGENIEILCGSALDSDVMSKSLISETEVMIAVTDSDELNILSCLLAKKQGVKRIASIINNTMNTSLFYTLGINTIFAPKKAVTSKILHCIKNEEYDKIFTYADNQIDVIAISISEYSRAIGALIDDICSDKKTIVGALLRQDETYIYPKRKVINAGDKILLAVEKKNAAKLVAMFRDKPKYLT
jgi:trk system potassium uptake protein TrkA